MPYARLMVNPDAPHDEIEAMRQVASALNPLSEDERGRVLRWASERFGVAAPKSGNDNNKGAESETPDIVEPVEAGDLFARASPTTDAERALVVGYWAQGATADSKGFDALTVNKQLKQLGHGVGNITTALDDLKARKPQLVIQLQKSGRSKQARKLYKVTTEGVKYVQQMLSKAS